MRFLFFGIIPVFLLQIVSKLLFEDFRIKQILESEGNKETRDDNIYHGTATFIGIHSNHELELSEKQKELFKKTRYLICTRNITSKDK